MNGQTGFLFGNFPTVHDKGDCGREKHDTQKNLGVSIDKKPVKIKIIPAPSESHRLNFDNFFLYHQKAVPKYESGGSEEQNYAYDGHR